MCFCLREFLSVCVCDAKEEGLCVCVCPGGREEADGLMERSKVEQSMTLRKLQTLIRVAWSVLELKAAPQRTEPADLCHPTVSVPVCVICFSLPTRNSSCACGETFGFSVASQSQFYTRGDVIITLIKGQIINERLLNDYEELVQFSAPSQVRSALMMIFLINGSFKLNFTYFTPPY